MHPLRHVGKVLRFYWGSSPGPTACSISSTKDETLNSRQKHKTCPLCWNIKRPSNLKAAKKKIPKFLSHPSVTEPRVSGGTSEGLGNVRVMCRGFVWCFVLFARDHRRPWLMIHHHRGDVKSPEISMSCQWTKRAWWRTNSLTSALSPSEKWWNRQLRCLFSFHCSDIFASSKQNCTNGRESKIARAGENQFLPNWKMFGSMNKFFIIFDGAERCKYEITQIGDCRVNQKRASTLCFHR